MMGAVKVWASHPDKILATLSGDLVDRRNLRIRLQNEPWDPQRIDELKRKVADHLTDRHGRHGPLRTYRPAS